MRTARQTAHHARCPFVVVAVALGVAALTASSLSVIGSDALWLPALGDYIRETASIPVGIPFAAAPSGGWVNTTVLGQVIMSVAFSAGSIGLVTAQVLAVITTLGLLSAQSIARGARPVVTVLVIAGVAVGAAAPLLIVRAQLLSLVPFVLLLVLMRRQHNHPSRAIWWAVPLIAVWSNLHGAVLVGVAVLGCHLVFSRLSVSPVTAVSVGLASLVATCLNPGLLQAPSYYFGVFRGAATNDESGMWSRLSLGNPFDVLLVATALALILAAVRRRRPLWEYAAGLGLLIATVTAARHGIWLLLFLFVPAASPAEARSSAAASRRPSAVAVLTALACAAGCVGVIGYRASSFISADVDAGRIAAATRGSIVLSSEPLVESLAAAGATVWASNPLDAFAPADQAAYLAFMNGDGSGARRALDGAETVVAEPESPQFRVAVAHGFVTAGNVGPYAILRRS